MSERFCRIFDTAYFILLQDFTPDSVPGVPVAFVYIRLQVKLLFTAAFLYVQDERRLPYASNKSVHLKHITGGQLFLPEYRRAEKCKNRPTNGGCSI